MAVPKLDYKAKSSIIYQTSFRIRNTEVAEMIMEYEEGTYHNRERKQSWSQPKA
jgi:hypothetical protein